MDDHILNILLELREAFNTRFDNYDPNPLRELHLKHVKGMGWVFGNTPDFVTSYSLVTILGVNVRSLAEWVSKNSKTSITLGD